jgi:hypothetical protein
MSGVPGHGGPGSQGDDGTRNESSGVVYGPSIQAHNIGGDLHFYQSTSVPPPGQPQPGALPPPNQLPQVSQLTGRARDVTTMDAARDGHVMVLTGPPGVGKTALAVAWGHRTRGDFPDGVLYSDLHGHAPDGPASPAEVLGRFPTCQTDVTQMM